MIPQVLQDRGESGSRHGRAAFSILLLQDLAVVVVLMLIPLLAPKAGASSGGLGPIAKALGLAGVKAVICMTSIIVGGRVILRPLYRFFAGFENEEIFAALTLLIVLGTSELTQSAGLSLALGAFLAGLLVAETEYALQVLCSQAYFTSAFVRLWCVVRLYSVKVYAELSTA